MKKLISLAMCAVLSLSLVACSSETTTDSADDTLKVALCVTGAVNDLGWNQSAYEGLLAVEEAYDAEITYTENLTTADITAALTDYAASGYDIVIGHGFQFGEPSVEVSELYPDTKFICIESESASENVASYVMKCEESAFVNGMIAASMSETGKLGFIGPTQGASLVKIVNGFEDGAKYINPDIVYSAVWSGSYTDTALALESAKAMIESGVDVVGHCANECGTGAINAAVDAGIYAIGDSYDQSSLAPDTILTSAIYDVPALITQAVSDIVDGTFKGEIVELGMAEGIVYLAPLSDAIPADVQTLVEETVEQIISGEFEVVCDTVARQ